MLWLLLSFPYFLREIPTYFIKSWRIIRFTSQIINFLSEPSLLVKIAKNHSIKNRAYLRLRVFNTDHFDNMKIILIVEETDKIILFSGICFVLFFYWNVLLCRCSLDQTRPHPNHKPWSLFEKNKNKNYFL